MTTIARTAKLEAHGRSFKIYERTPDEVARWVVRGVRTGRPYDAKLLEHVYRRRYRGLAVDVGANVGGHTLWLAAICDLRVAAFEPLTANALRRNVQLNHLDRKITVYDVALGSDVAWARHVGKRQLELTNQQPPLPVGVNVPVHRLDDYDLRPSLVRVDAGALSHHVLRGAERTVQVHRPVVYAPGDWRPAVADVLGAWGYRRTTAVYASTVVDEWVYRGS